MYSCKILSCDHEPIPVEHQKPLVIGRGPLTKIKDPRLSRNHIELIADCNVGQLSVKLIGANACKAGSVILRQKNDSVLLKHGELIELLEKQYPYRVQFDPVPACNTAPNLPIDNMVGKQTNLHNFFTKGKGAEDFQAKRQKTEDTWLEVDGGELIIFTTDGVEPKSKIAAFDLDGTIITTQSGRVFPANTQDWKLLFSEIPGKLKQLKEEGYKIVFITNQAGMKKGKPKPLDFRQKLSDIRTKLGVPIQVFISPGDGKYRKPSPGMWNYLEDKANGGVQVELDSSFYCGDAAGRDAKWAPGKKKDHSSVDRHLAVNVGLKFYTPEEFFLGHPPVPYKEPDFQPSSVNPQVPLLEPPDAPLFEKHQEVILLVGFPASGKSHFANYHASQSGYDVINRDSLGTMQKCVDAMKRSLDGGKSVLIDNTNPDKESRSCFVRLVSTRGLPCRCFIMNTTMTHSQHNNKFRELTGDKHVPVSQIVFNTYKSKYQEPSLEEGFSQIVRVNFRPEFRSAEEERLYKMYLL